MLNKYIFSLISVITISVVSSTTFANPTNGPIRDRDFIARGDEIYYDFSLNSDEVSIIKVHSLRDYDDVDCYLYDSNYTLVDMNEDIGGCTIIIIPDYTGMYQLTVRDSGKKRFSTFELNVY